jgi:hypothetical protein
MNVAHGLVSENPVGELDYFVVERDPYDDSLGWVYWEATWDLDSAISLVAVRIDDEGRRILVGKAFVINNELGGNWIATADLEYLRDRLGVGSEYSMFASAMEAFFGEYSVEWALTPLPIPDLRVADVIAWSHRCADFIDMSLRTAPNNSVMTTALPHLVRRMRAPQTRRARR